MHHGTVLDGETVIPHPAQLGWNVEHIAGIYIAMPTYTLAKIYEMLTGEKEQPTTVKELSDRSGRPVIVFIQHDRPRFYTPQRYHHFSPVALTYSPTSSLFGMKDDRQEHHDYSCFLCAYSLRIENVADVPNAILYPYITGAKKAIDYEKKMELLHGGRMKLMTVARGIDEAGDFNDAIVNMLQEEKFLSECHVISLLKHNFATRKLSKIDSEGVNYAESLKIILRDHDGNTKVADDLYVASIKVGDCLDKIMKLAENERLTDELLATMKTKTDIVTEDFNECMKPHISVENDIYSWTSLSSMESGNVRASYPRHQVFQEYKEDKIQGQKELNLLVTRRNNVGQIGIDERTTFETVATYISTVENIDNDILNFDRTSRHRPNISLLKDQLSQMKLRGKKFADVVSSLKALGGLDHKQTLCSLVIEVISICENISLENVFHLKIPQVVTIGQALKAVDMETKLPNACFELTPAYQIMVSKILKGDPEEILPVKFRQKTVEAEIVDLQPMGNPKNSPFAEAIKQWAAIRTRVQSVAQNMKAKIVKYATFSSPDIKDLLSTKLLPVTEYETFIKQITLWNIIDVQKETVQNIMYENLKFIRVIQDEFPNQEDTNCASMRVFISSAKLTYTLHKKDSVLNAILSNNRYKIDDDFKETALEKMDVGSLAYRYTSSMQLQVKDVETLLHYLLSAYEKNAEYGPILHHLSQNSERMALLNQIVEDYVKRNYEDEDDADRVSNICANYISNFMVPYTASTACLNKNDKLVQVDWTGKDNFLTTSSVLNNIVMNRIIQGADIEEANVKIEELARAMKPQRLYIVTHVGKTLSWGSYLSGDTSVGYAYQWRNILLLQLKCKTWNVNIRDIIALHKELYVPKETTLSTEFSDSTFFLAHERESLVVWYVNQSCRITFPTESPAEIKFGNTQFTKGKSLQSVQASKKESETTAVNNVEEKLTLTQLNEAKHGLRKDEVKGTETEDSQEEELLDTITHGIAQLHVGSPPQQLKGGTLGESVVNEVVPHTIGRSEPIVPIGVDVMSSVGKTFAHTSNRTFTQAQTNIIQNKEPLFVKYTARVNPWKVWRRQSAEDRNAIRHLMQTRIQLSDNSSEEAEDS